MLLLSLALSLSAHAAAPSPGAALELFRQDKAVTAALAEEARNGYLPDGEAGAVLYSHGFGDEGYCSAYLASQPLAKGTNPAIKTVRLVAARVTLCWPHKTVELLSAEGLAIGGDRMK